MVPTAKRSGSSSGAVLGRIAAADPDAIGLGDFEGARDAGRNLAA